MKTKSYNIYSFAELSPKARERAIENARQHIIETWDGEATIEDAKQAFTYAGFDIKTVHYSGFSCQGDGASFVGTWSAAKVNAAGMRDYAPVDTELHRIADELGKLAASCPTASFRVTQSGHYSHEYSTAFDFTLPEPDLSDVGPYATPEDEELARDAKTTEARLREDRANEDLAALEKELTELARDAMRWIYRQLEKEYDYETAEAQVIQSIEANDYEFTEEGRID